MTLRLSRRQYADLYGPTTGDRVRLADTDLRVEVEEDHVGYGDEPLWGYGKNIRSRMAQSDRVAAESRRAARRVLQSRAQAGTALSNPERLGRSDQAFAPGGAILFRSGHDEPGVRPARGVEPASRELLEESGALLRPEPFPPRLERGLAGKENQITPHLPHLTTGRQGRLPYLGWINPAIRGCDR